MISTDPRAMGQTARSYDKTKFRINRLPLAQLLTKVYRPLGVADIPFKNERWIADGSLWPAGEKIPNQSTCNGSGDQINSRE